MHGANALLQALPGILLVELGFAEAVKWRRQRMPAAAGRPNRVTGAAESFQQALRALLLAVERICRSLTSRQDQHNDKGSFHGTPVCQVGLDFDLVDSSTNQCRI